MIAIIDYDAGNLRSVEKALSFLGEEVIVTRKTEELEQADKLILPGVGAFGEAMDRLHSYHLVDAIQTEAAKGKPFLGICLGMQLMFESSEESPGVLGLGLLKGTILRIPDCNNLKIPHIGWNSLTVKENATLFQNIAEEPYVYFVHSYYLQAGQQQDVAATTEYGVLIHASVEHNNIFGCQFHPEKSSDVGMQILKNFASIRSRKSAEENNVYKKNYSMS